jgi:hypothetical protein
MNSLDNLEFTVFQKEVIQILYKRMSRGKKDSPYQKHTNVDRDIEIFCDRIFGNCTYEEIGRLHDISSNRARQIVDKATRIFHDILRKA